MGDFQLTQAHERRIVLKQLRRVRLAADGGRLFATHNEIGLGRLLGFRDFVHQVFHVARQDHIADTDRSNFQTQLTSPTADVVLDLLRDNILVRQEDIEFACSDHAPQYELRIAVQGLSNVVGLADCLASVNNLVGHDSIQPQRDLVRGHDLLTPDIDHRLAQINFNDPGFRSSLPEGIQPRVKRLDVAAIDEQNTDTVTINGADIQHTLRQRRACNHLQLFVFEPNHTRVDNLNADILLTGPVRKQASWQNMTEPVLDPDDRPLVIL